MKLRCRTRRIREVAEVDTDDKIVPWISSVSETDEERKRGRGE
jgi:hypothetical protein